MSVRNGSESDDVVMSMVTRMLSAVIAVTAIACQPSPAWRGFDIRALPPALTTGSGKAALNGAGDLMLDVSVRGPAEEVSRQGQNPLEPNFIWHVVEGDCAAWSQPGVESRHKVLYRWTPVPTQPDAMSFQTTIPKSSLDDMSRPHALAAFRNGGGGPLYACGDLPQL